MCLKVNVKNLLCSEPFITNCASVKICNLKSCGVEINEISLLEGFFLCVATSMNHEVLFSHELLPAMCANLKHL